MENVLKRSTNTRRKIRLSLERANVTTVTLQSISMLKSPTILKPIMLLLGVPAFSLKVNCLGNGKLEWESKGRETFGLEQAHAKLPGTNIQERGTKSMESLSPLGHVMTFILCKNPTQLPTFGLINTLTISWPLFNEKSPSGNNHEVKRKFELNKKDFIF